MVKIIDKAFTMVSKKRNKPPFKQKKITKNIWDNLIRHSLIGTVFIFDNVEFSLIFLDESISVIDIEKYKKERKQALQQTPTNESTRATIVEKTQDDNTNRRRLAPIWK